MGVFVSDFVSALAVRIGPSRQARADTDCYGQIQSLIQKHPYDNIYYPYHKENYYNTSFITSGLKIMSKRFCFIHNLDLSF